MGISRSLVIIFALFVAIAPAISFAREFIVGDSFGWSLGVNYTVWAQGKQFSVGDNLVFKYNNNTHNVYKVNGTDFQNCIVPKNNSLRLSTGLDAIPLAAPGDKWYICGFTKHCASGMKLKITVLESAPAPNSASTSRAIEPIFRIISGIIITIVSMIMVN